jgi:ribonuclease I
MYDYYIFSLTYEPGYCGESDCLIDYVGTPRLELHGLWPQNFDTTYPVFCETKYKLLSYPEIKTVNGICKIAPWYCTQNGANFEYEKHGSCMEPSISPLEYLELKKKLYDTFWKEYRVSLNKFLQKQSATFEEFKLQFPFLTIELGKQNQLLEIWQCLDKNFRQISCPSNIEPSWSLDQKFIIPKKKSSQFPIKSSFTQKNEISFITDYS